MKYLRETGGILNSQRQLLHIVDGQASHVDFPPEVIQALHQQSPGIVYAMSHVHPPQMSNLSPTDINMLEAWAYALYPFPARLITLAEIEPTAKRLHVQETCFIATVESKSSWESRGKDSPREVQITKEYEMDQYYSPNDHNSWYGRLLLSRSYEENIEMDTTGLAATSTATESGSESD